MNDSQILNVEQEEETEVTVKERYVCNDIDAATFWTFAKINFNGRSRRRPEKELTYAMYKNVYRKQNESVGLILELGCRMMC